MSVRVHYLCFSRRPSSLTSTTCIFSPSPPKNNETRASFLEEGYFRQDPFTDRSRPLFIGADCSTCSRPVCGQHTCSMFYTRRFCAACAKQNEVCVCERDARFNLFRQRPLTTPPSLTPQGAFPLELRRDLVRLARQVLVLGAPSPSIT